MSPMAHNILAVLLVGGMVWGIRWMSSPSTAVRGNLLGAGCVLAGIVLTLGAHGILDDWLLWASMAAGAAAGWWLAVKTVLLKVPQLVGLFNGLGGAASAIAGFIVLVALGDSSRIAERLTAGLALAVGTVTFSGSAVAAGKLDRRIPQRPIILPGHNRIAGVLGIAVAALVAVAAVPSIAASSSASVATGVLGLALGAVVSLRVGGADMPITISLLNSLSGVSGSLAGFAVRDPILVAAGGIVGAAGLILTFIMCRAANRSLLRILLGQESVVARQTSPHPAEEKETPKDSVDAGSAALAVSGPPADLPREWANGPDEETPERKRARIARILLGASRVVVVPGYGMALAEAQREVKRLMDALEARGKDIRCAIHPLAGRMPGHMHVLLAEAEVPYERLFDMAKINDQFGDVDAVVVVGANDVINPAASTAVKTPIYGMPVLRVSEARSVIVLNQDTLPGYAGVPNPLYTAPNTVLYLGDAAQTVREITEELERN